MGKKSLQKICQKNSFLAAILASAIAAAILPRLGATDGPLTPHLTANFLAPWIIYINSGITIKPEELKASILHCRLNACIQIVSLIALPVFTMLCSGLVSTGAVSSWVWKGLALMSCLPGSVTSGLVLVGCARGNQAAAVVSSILGSLVAVFVSPVMLLFILGSTTPIPLYAALETLIGKAVVPLAVGQLAHLAGTWPRTLWKRCNMHRLSQAALVFSLYVSFCDTFSTLRVDVSAQTLLVTLFLVVALQVTAMIIILFTTARLGFSTADRVAIVLCAVQKSTALGIPMVRLLYSGLHHMDEVMLPLLLAGPTQAILGALAASALNYSNTSNSRSLAR